MVLFCLQDKDPFWEDPNSEVHLGSVHVYLQSLAYMMELEESLQVTDYRGMEQGERPTLTQAITLIEEHWVFLVGRSHV